VLLVCFQKYADGNLRSFHAEAGCGWPEVIPVVMGDISLLGFSNALSSGRTCRLSHASNSKGVRNKGALIGV
jgi:hypothetical protein